jgi:type I restriction enzyme S subunit
MSETVQIPKGWELKKISQLCTVVRGGSPRPKGDPLYFGGSIPWIMISDATRNKGKFLKETKQGLTEAGVPKSRFLKSETLILTNSATICLPKILKIDGCIHDGFLAFLNLKEIERDFLYYFFLAYRTKITQTVARGLAQKNLNIDLVSNIEILLPPIPIQTKIVQKLDDILGQLEEKKKEIFSIIEQNKGRIDFFEKNWRAYIITNLIEKHCQENKTVKVMFEDVTKNITYGFTNPMPHTKEGHWLLTAKDIKNGFIDYSNALKTDDNSFENLLTEKSRPEIGLVLITKDGTLGRTAILDKKGVCINQSIASLEPIKLKISSEFLAYVLESSSIQSKIKDDNKRSTIGHIQITKLAKWEFDLPELPTQKQIIQNIKSAEEKFQSQKVQFENIKQNYENTVNHINHIQSSILDAAFSGKLIQ